MPYKIPVKVLRNLRTVNGTLFYFFVNTDLVFPFFNKEKYIQFVQFVRSYVSFCYV